jgi:hypothetical protein
VKGRDASAIQVSRELSRGKARSFLSMWQELRAIVDAPFSRAAVGAVSGPWNQWLAAARQSGDFVCRDLDGRAVPFSDLSPAFRRAMVEELGASFPADRARALHVTELLDQLHYVAVSGSEWSRAELSLTEERLVIDGHQVMDVWEAPIMHAMVDRCLEACRDPGRSSPLRVLELGWGMGISGRRFLKGDVDYTVVEAHAAIAADAERAIGASGRPGRAIHALWQEAPLPPASFDVIFFDVYYTTYDREKNGDYLKTVAQHFLPLLAEGGVFTYFLSNNPGQIATLLRAGFDAVTCSRVTGIIVPDDCSYAPPGQQEWLNVVARKGGGSASRQPAAHEVRG